ncbi:hypothetical protein [Pseudomonas salomonii]|uniref:Uncharacterized protein n=1 Tax=Pseudomonas salomonii TaxID=191391 RepID=A0A1H3J972_9PSED|nr:hypothetical protein [Pseudomonas salomonii]SDY36560.1 hypothetical protein SAMN05216247_103505 [Pseudomonas salomonii]
MSFSLFEKPELAIGLALGFLFLVFITFKFVWKRNVNVKAKKGSVAINGENNGDITIKSRKGK